MKKKNNPFKMWGSWVGAVIGFLINFKIWGYETTMDSSKVFLVERFKIFVTSFASQYNNLVVVDYTIFIILGFLLGWGITILYRRLTK